MYVSPARVMAAALLVGAAAIACGGDDTNEPPVGDAPASLEVSPSEITLAPDETRPLNVVVKDAAGQELSASGVVWSVADDAVATVSASGVVRGVSAGETTVTATLGPLSDDVTVNVLGSAVPADAVIGLDAAARYQTMKGWEATAEVGQFECASYPRYVDELFDRAVDELGLDRIRLPVRSSAEHSVDHFARFISGQITRQEWASTWDKPQNDNPDPFSINPAGFQFSHLDYLVEKIVEPLRQRLAARGERLYVNLNFTDFDSTPFDHEDQPEEYAEFMLATFQHLQAKYGWVPDAVEMVLEPDVGHWSAAQVGAALVAAGNRLKAHGFTPEFIAPSNASMEGAVTYFDEIIRLPGAAEYLTMLSYHRYRHVSAANLQAIRARAAQYGIETGMLEHIRSDHDDLKEDLRVANNSAWQQYTIAFCSSDNGGHYYSIDEAAPGGPAVKLGSRTRYLRQYFRWVRQGAVRIEATTTDSAYDPVAFINANGKYTVVVDAARAGTLRVDQLPAGTYGVNYTTANAFDVDGGDVVLSQGQPLVASIPAAGVITIYGK